MTNSALATIDTTPLAFEAHLTGAVQPTADFGAKVAIRTWAEINDEVMNRLVFLARHKIPGFCVFVPDAKSIEQVNMPPVPKIEAKDKKAQSPSSLHRFALECLAEELGENPKAFYGDQMQKSTAKVWERIEDIRREKAFMQ